MTTQPSAVRGTIIDADGDRHGWTPDLDDRMAALESPVREVLGPELESLAGTGPGAETGTGTGTTTDTEPTRITIVPDTHYPFHPSTGMVTDPAVVGAIVDHLDWRTDATITVAGTSTEFIEFDRTADYLGYPELVERFDAELVDLSADGSRETRKRSILGIDGSSVGVSAPELLRESAVLTVPTLRPTESGAVAGGMRTLATLVESAADPDLATAAATRAIGPVCSLLDATTAYGDGPYAANTLLAGPTPAVDAVGASLLGQSSADDGALELAFACSDTEAPVRVEVVGAGSAGSAGSADDAVDDDPKPDLEHHLTTVRNRLDAGELPPPDATHPAVSIAYRLYAAVAGDAVPPQIEARGGQ